MFPPVIRGQSKAPREQAVTRHTTIYMMRCAGCHDKNEFQADMVYVRDDIMDEKPAAPFQAFASIVWGETLEIEVGWFLRWCAMAQRERCCNRSTCCRTHH